MVTGRLVATDVSFLRLSAHKSGDEQRGSDQSKGGAVRVQQNGVAEFYRCTFGSNEAEIGGAVQISGDAATGGFVHFYGCFFDSNKVGSHNPWGGGYPC